MFSFCKYLCLILVVFFSGMTNANAVVIDASTGIYEAKKETEIDYTDLGKELKRIEDFLKSGQATQNDFNEYLKVMITIKGHLSDIRKNIEKDLGFVKKRIEALGIAPEKGEAVIEAIAKKRQDFNEEALYYKTRLVDVDILLAKINELESIISNTRNKELIGRLLDKEAPLIYPNIFFNAVKQFVMFGVDIVKSPVMWYKNLNYEQLGYVNSNVLHVAFFVLLFFILGLYIRILIIKKFGYQKDLDSPKYITKVVAAISVSLAYGAVPACIAGGFLLWMQSTEVMTIGLFGLVVTSSLKYFLYIFLSTAVARVIFAPNHGDWRLADVSDDKAKKIKIALYWSIILIGMFSLLESIAIKAHYPINLVSFLSVISGAVKVFSFLLVSKRVFWDDSLSSKEVYKNRDIGSDDEYYDDSGEKSSKITFLLSVFSIIFFLVSLFGYPRLSSYLLNRFLATFIMIGLFSIIKKSVAEIIHRLLLFFFWSTNFKLRRKFIVKVEFWFNLFIDTTLFIFVSLSMLSLWGVPRALIFDWISKLLFGFKIGDVEISLVSIIMGVVIFITSIAVVRILKNKLMVNILAKMDIEEGIRHSLASGFGFVGFIIAAIIGILIMGGNLTNLALIAGALSFGIGLGLQNIVNNFVSGIILLFERPVKVGDWVNVNNYEGIIKQVNIRATELELWNRSVVVIPNADFLSTSVVNYTLHNKMGRIEVPVSVAYGSDIKRVEKVLLEIAKANKRVLKTPEPFVVFINFGNTALDFQLRCFAADIMTRMAISSEIRYEINRRFIEEGIRLAIPQIMYRNSDENFNQGFLNHKESE